MTDYQALYFDAVAVLKDAVFQSRLTGKNRRARCGSCGIEIVLGPSRHAPGCQAARVLAHARALKRAQTKPPKPPAPKAAPKAPAKPQGLTTEVRPTKAPTARVPKGSPKAPPKAPAARTRPPKRP